MKRVLIVLSILVLLLTAFPGLVLAGSAPDVTPPVISGIGRASPVYLTKPCWDLNQILMVQAKVTDAGILQRVWVQWKQPGDLVWHNKDMGLRPDGYWRAFSNGPWINAGTGVFRIRARDMGGNVTTSGIRTFAINGCTAPNPF